MLSLVNTPKTTKIDLTTWCGYSFMEKILFALNFPGAVLCLVVTVVFACVLMESAIPASEKPYMLLDPPAVQPQEPITPIPLSLALDPPRVALGERLFHDVRLSYDNTRACIMCHPLQRGGMDGEPHASAANGIAFLRNTPTIFNVGFNAALNWDGIANTLEAHAEMDLLHLSQMNTTWPELLAKLQAAAFQDAVLRYATRVEARAQRFRVLLYLVAVMLLGYLLYQFARLRANARDLRRANADLELEMSERQQAVAALRTSEERFRAITESANDAIISADSAGHIVSWNARAEAIFGYTAEEILGAPLTRLMPACCRADHAQRFAQWSATGAAHLIGTITEFSGVRKDGNEFPLKMSLSTWSTAHGHYVTGIIRDLTAHKQLQETTRQQELQLIQAKKMTALGTLVSGVAHEINSPNQVVLMNAGVLAKAWDDAVDI
jgi:PAS domain S-box-containing protein